MHFLYCAAFAVLTLAKADKWCCDQPADFEGKIAMIIAFNDHNNDSIVDLGDIQYDLDTHYDKNHDNKTSKVEWVLTRNCFIGDSFGYAEYLFGLVDRTKDGFITVEDVALGPIGTAPMTTAAYQARSRVRYQTYASGSVIG